MLISGIYSAGESVEAMQKLQLEPDKIFRIFVPVLIDIFIIQPFLLS
jgi:hypothetical protein